MPGPSFSLTSLGCRVNQAEAEYLAGALEALGWQRVERGQSCQWALLMTCAVTASAARQSRQMARRLAKETPGVRVLATGCGAQAEHEAYAAEGAVVVGRAHLADLPGMLAAGALPDTGAPPPPDAGAFCPGALPSGPRRSRAMLKVQDGCDAHCAYCIVPSTRGRPRSLPPDQAAAAWRDLAAGGAPEVVLTGIHLGRWGWDMEPTQSLEQLVRVLLDAHPEPRLRLSSLESHEVTPGLISLAAAEPRICRHLHLPLQSGSDKVLAAMGRPYDSAQYAAVARAVKQAMPGACLGADVLVGLPGEDQAAFDDTYALIESLPIDYLHVFPYSPRPGTRAAAMGRRPDGQKVNRRAAKLRKLGRAKKMAFLEGLLGRTLEVIMEGGGMGRSSEYALVRLDDAPPHGQTATALVHGVAHGSKEPHLTARRIK